MWCNQCKVRFSCPASLPLQRKIHGKQGCSWTNEQILEALAFQDGLSGPSPESTLKGRLVSVVGPPGHILTYPHLSLALRLPGIRGKEGGISVYQTPLRTSSHSLGRHEASNSGGYMLSGSGCLHSNV